MKYIKMGVKLKQLISAVMSLGLSHLPHSEKVKDDDIQVVKVKVDYDSTCQFMFDSYIIDETTTDLVKAQAKLIIKPNGQVIYTINRSIKYRGYPDSDEIKQLFATYMWRYNQQIDGR